MRVLDDTTFTNVPRIAAVISGGEDQRHLGLLYRRGDAELRKLHLGFHHYLCDDAPDLDGTSAWIGCGDLDDTEANTFATWLAKIWEKNHKRMPYGIRYWRGPHFDLADGKYLPSETGCGLTCATFVMALFEAFRYDIVDIETWPNRDSDVDFQNCIIEALNNPRHVRNVDIDSAEHQAHVKSQIDSLGKAPRFRPEEVACSVGLCEGEPISFQVAEPAGQALVSKMRDSGVFR